MCEMLQQVNLIIIPSSEHNHNASRKITEAVYKRHYKNITYLLSSKVLIFAAFLYQVT